MCGKTERSSAERDCDWRMIEVDRQHRYYACPDEFPPDGSGVQAFKEAYTAIFAKIIILQAEERRHGR
jgi:hypothetical protein